MATSHGIVFNDAPTVATGTQDYTKSSLGTVKGYLMFGSEDTAANTNFDDVQWQVGASDLSAVNGSLLGVNYEDDQATSDSKTLMHATRLLGLADAGTDGEDEGCNHNATLTDGIQVDWTNIQSARLCTALMFKEGVDNFNVQLVVLNGTGSTTISGVGFNPDVVICVSAGQDAITYGPQGATAGVQFYKQTSNAYAGMYFAGSNGQTSHHSAMYYTTSAIGGNVNVVTANLDSQFTLSNFGADGFDAIKVSQTGTRVVMFISIGVASGYSTAVGTITAPGSTGVASTITGLDHTPQVALFTGSGQSSLDDGTDSQSDFFFGACDADAEVNMGGWIQDSDGVVENTSAGGWHRDDSCIYQHNGVSLRNKASFDSFQSDGVDLNWTTATDLIKVGYLTIGPDISASTGSPSRHASRRGVGRGVARGVS
jgi:hypothetical protein